MIKVVNIISDTNIGGAGRCLLNYLKYCDRSLFQIKVIMPNGSLLKSEVEKLDTPVIEIEGIGDKSLDWSAISKLKKLIRSENAQIVHTHGAMSGRIAGRLAGAKVVFTRHSVFPVSPKLAKNPGRTINKWVNEFFADEMIAVAEAAKENLTDAGISSARVTVILNGVEPVSPLSAEEKAASYLKYGVSEDDFVIGILARLNPVKGHKYLVEAAHLLKQQNRRIKVIIAGVGSSEDDLKAQIRELGLEDTVLMPGFVSDIRGLLGIMDVQANASFGTEATSLALLEGMSLGIPAVVSDYGGNPGVIKNGENGFLFPTHNAQAMADCLAKLMDDKDLYQHLSVRCLEIFNETFTAEHYAHNIESVYLRMMHDKGEC